MKNFPNELNKDILRLLYCQLYNSSINLVDLMRTVSHCGICPQPQPQPPFPVPFSFCFTRIFNVCLKLDAKHICDYVLNCPCKAAHAKLPIQNYPSKTAHPKLPMQIFLIADSWHVM